MSAGCWELDLELAVEALARTGDRDAFRAALRRLGFDDQEIDDWLQRELG